MNESIEGTDALRIHQNSVQCQKICYGGVKLHHHSHEDAADMWDYPIAASVLLTLPGHPHVESYESLDVHTGIPFGVSIQSPTEWSFELTNQVQMAANTVWRDEIYITLESYKIVNFAIDSRSRHINITHVLN